MIARLVLFVLLLLPTSAFAADMMVMNAVVQPPLVATNKVGALYMMVMNHGSAEDKLIGIATPVAESVELHESLEENGIAKMRPVGSIVIAAGGMAELKPGGMHAMLMGIKQPLEKGAKLPITLKFEKAGEVAAEATVGDLASIHNHGAATTE